MVALYEHEKSKDAIADHELLADVIKYKKLFYNASYAHYDACLTGGLRLVPQGDLKKALESDFKSMVQAGMFYGEPLSFQKILSRLTEVEQLLNQSIMT